MTNKLSICITGAESSGKTTLCDQLSLSPKVHVVSEFARSYLSAINRSYNQKDLVYIAQNQFDLLQSAIRDHEIVILDTGVEVVKIWHEEKYGTSSKINTLLTKQNQLLNHYALCSPDIPWEEDPLRESPNDRERLHKLYIALLSSHEVPFSEISGSIENRLKLITSIMH